MSSILFTRLPFSIVDGTLPVIPSSDISPLVDYEIDSYDHWIFDRGATSLSGLKAGSALTPPVASTHSFTANSLLLSPQSGKGLQSTLDDQAQQTMIVVLKRPARTEVTLEKFHVIAGTLRNAAGDTLGSGIYLNIREIGDVGQDAAQAWQQPRTAPQRPTQNLTATAGQYFFVAMSEGGTNPSTVINYLGGVGALPSTVATAKTPASRKVSLGNLTYNETWSATTPNLEIAEFILFNAALSATDLADVYNRSKIRLATRGITVV